MSLVAFLSGLAVGLVVCVVRHVQCSRQIQKILDATQASSQSSATYAFGDLKRAIAQLDAQRQSLARSVAIWQQLMRVAPIGFIQVDEEGQLVWCNEEARRVLGIHRWHEGEPCLMLRLVRSYELDQLIEEIREAQQSRMLEWVFHTTVQDTTGSRQQRSLSLRAVGYPLPDNQVGVFIENRQEFVRLSQARERWMSDLAHELKTPLTSIRLVAETLQGHLTAPMDNWVERMLVEINRLIQLVRDWLELSQLEVEPSKRLNRKPTELNALIRTVWQSLEPLAQKKQLRFMYEGAVPLWIEADESRLHRVFLNIFDNSIRYCSPGDRIQVIANPLVTKDEAETTVQIDLIDSGPGFPESAQPHVFERLYRADSARDRGDGDGDGAMASSGSGLGLAIVQQIIQAHGGCIRAQNHPQTGGAWLQIHLPAAPCSTKVSS